MTGKPKLCPFLLAGLLANPVIVCDDGSFRESFADYIDYDCLREECMLYVAHTEDYINGCCGLSVRGGGVMPIVDYPTCPRCSAAAAWAQSGRCGCW